VADGHDKLEAQVLTPEGEVFNGELVQLSTRTAVGEVGILARHIPMVARLVPAELRLHKSDSEVLRFAQGEGFLQMSGTHALVLVDEVFPIDELHAGTVADRLREAEQRVERAEEDSEERRQAERDRRRYEAFSKLAENRLERADEDSEEGRQAARDKRRYEAFSKLLDAR